MDTILKPIFLDLYQYLEKDTHMVIYLIFYKKLKKKIPKILKVLGNGLQKKSYLNVTDCIDAIFIALKKSNEK